MPRATSRCRSQSRCAAIRARSARQSPTHCRSILRLTGLVAAAEVAGPGFVNVRLTAEARQEVVRQALRERESFGTQSVHAGERVMVEFVSANPTGPLHLGHARQAALGDALANLLAAEGWQVAREYYYNDAGVQIANLALSVQARARELRGEKIEFPETGYRGDYIVDIARDFLQKRTVTARDGQPVTASGDPTDLEAVRHFAVVYLRNEQDADLAALGVSFDHYFLESSLYTDGKVDATVSALIEFRHDLSKRRRRSGFEPPNSASLRVTADRRRTTRTA